MEWDQNKIDDTVLALLQLTLHDGARVWKGFDFEVMDRLFEKGYIFDPRNKSKSIVLSPEGLARSKERFDELFGKRRGMGAIEQGFSGILGKQCANSGETIPMPGYHYSPGTKTPNMRHGNRLPISKWYTVTPVSSRTTA